MKSVLFGMVAGVAFLGGRGALAQTAPANPAEASQNADRSNFSRDRNISVLERPHPEYDAQGLPLASFRLFPTVEVAVVSDDNIFAQPAGEVDDTIIRTDAELTARSQWSRHRLSLFGRVRRADYQDNGSENYTNYQVGATGQVDVRRNTSIGFGGDYGQFTEPRTSSNAPTNAAEPIDYTQAGLNLQLVHSFNRLRLLGRVDRVDLDYDNGENALGGVVFQDDRDRSITAVTGRAEYAVSPSTAVFFESVFNTRDYDLSAPVVATDRDSDGSEITVGANFDLSRLVRGEFQVGYLTQDYAAADLEDFENITGRARLEWFPSDLLTVSFVGGRTVEDATGVGISGYLSSTAGVTADYEVRRNIVLSANATYEAADYGDIDRNDDIWTAQVEATYKVNRTLAIKGGFEHVERESSGLAAATDYQINRLQLAFVLQR